MGKTRLGNGEFHTEGSREWRSSEAKDTVGWALHHLAGRLLD